MSRKLVLMMVIAALTALMIVVASAGSVGAQDSKAGKKTFACAKSEGQPVFCIS